MGWLWYNKWFMEEIYNARKKKEMFDSAIDVSIVNLTKDFKQKMKLVNEHEYKIFEYISTSKMKNDKIEFENYSLYLKTIFENVLKNNNLTWESDDFELSIKSVAVKEKQFVRNIEIKKILKSILTR